MKTTNPMYVKTMGQRVGLSFFDSKLANLAYCKGTLLVDYFAPSPHDITASLYTCDPYDMNRMQNTNICILWTIQQS